MNRPSANARVETLERLRRSLATPDAQFGAGRDYAVEPPVPMAVTEAEGDQRTLAAQFGAKLEQLSGSYEIVDRRVEVPARLVRRIVESSAEQGGSGTKSAESDALEVLGWSLDDLPIPGLGQLLERFGISLVVPDDLHEPGCRARAGSTAVGLTAVDAAFASTGSVVLASGPGRSRAASLLPCHHIMLVPMSRIYPSCEAWLHRLRREGLLERMLRESGQIVFVTGPSRSADIELRLTLGVHGPGAVHAILFDDAR